MSLASSVTAGHAERAGAGLWAGALGQAPPPPHPRWAGDTAAGALGRHVVFMEEDGVWICLGGANTSALFRFF